MGGGGGGEGDKEDTAQDLQVLNVTRGTWQDMARLGKGDAARYGKL